MASRSYKMSGGNRATTTADKRIDVAFTQSQLKNMETLANTVKTRCEKLENLIQTGVLYKISGNIRLVKRETESMKDAEIEIGKIIKILEK